MNRPDVLPPYYHPTTVCFLDDNYSFLQALAAAAPDDLHHISFLSPEEALDVVNRPHRLPSLANRCFSPDHSEPGDPVMRLDLRSLAQEIKEVDRFARISVLLVDYAMPTMSGLDFCELIADPEIKRGLLTGVADEKTAVAAFNRGLIHRYIPKASLMGDESLFEHIEILQMAYFDQYRRELLSNFNFPPPEFITDPVVHDAFYATIEHHDVVEYYLIGEPLGYLMLRSDGSMVRFIAQHEAQLADQMQHAKAYGAPEHVLARLSSGDYIGYFDENPEDYLGHEPYPWDEMLVPATRLDGKRTWFVAATENPPADVDFDPAVCSYDSFLASVRN